MRFVWITSFEKMLQISDRHRLDVEIHSYQFIRDLRVNNSTEYFGNHLMIRKVYYELFMQYRS